MNAQNTPIEPSPTPEASSIQGECSRTKPTERAFVVQFDPIRDARSRLRGRAELVASGEATHFRSLKELVHFMAGILRRRAERADPRRPAE